MKDWFEAHSLESPTYRQIMELVHKTDLKGMVLDLLPPNLRHSQFIKSLVQEINHSYVKFYMPKYAIPINGAIECLLNLIKFDYKIAFITNATRLMMNQFFQMFNLYGIVDVAISADDVNKPKPHPSGLLGALRLINVEPEKAVFVGDTITDILTAKSANVVSIGVLSGIGKREDMEKVGADYIIESVASLLKRKNLGL